MFADDQPGELLPLFIFESVRRQILGSLGELLERVVRGHHRGDSAHDAAVGECELLKGKKSNVETQRDVDLELQRLDQLGLERIQIDPR